MTRTRLHGTDVAARLRAEFDASFSAPTRRVEAEGVELVLLGVASWRVGVWLEDLRSLHKNEKVVRLPSSSSAFLGVSNLEGHLTSVFDLGVLLGGSSKEPRSVHHCWLARLTNPGVALTFDVLERQVTVPRKAAPGHTNAGREVATRVELADLGALRLLDVEALVRVLSAAVPNSREGA